jgi:hypothetical protein
MALARQGEKDIAAKSGREDDVRYCDMYSERRLRSSLEENAILILSCRSSTAGCTSRASLRQLDEDTYIRRSFQRGQLVCQIWMASKASISDSKAQRDYSDLQRCLSVDARLLQVGINIVERLGNKD